MSKHSATSQQLRESTDRELTENELEHVSGGTPSAPPKDPPVRESISFPYSKIEARAHDHYKQYCCPDAVGIGLF
jgi:bacteriocin-like protein